jgi:sec-independent protein translocase protein TatC
VAQERDAGPRMTLSEHLEELRARLVRCLLATAVGFGIAFWKVDLVMEFLRRPLEGVRASMIQTKAYDGFMGAMMVAFFAGLLLASPLILHQVWAFVGAGLYRHERRMVKFYALPGFALFLGGAFLAYAFVMPLALRFLIGYASDELGIESMLNLPDYVRLIAWAMVVFGLMFQMPVIMVFLMRTGVVEPATFRRWRKAAIVAAFFFGMVLTPPDVMSQIILAGSLILLYEVAVLIGARVARPRRKDP